MKTLKALLSKSVLILLSLTVMLSSCSSDDDTSSVEQDDYYFTVKIDGVDFSSDTTPTVSFMADETGFFNIQGNLDNGDKLALTLLSPTATGTIQVSDDNMETAPRIEYSILSPFGVWAVGGSGGTERGGLGTIIITTNTPIYMEGTFSFTGVNSFDNTSKEFTEGKFKAKKL